MHIHKILLFGLSVGVFFYLQAAQPNSASHPNAPEGALEYFENATGDQYVILFDDALVTGDEAEDIEVEFYFDDISKVTTLGKRLNLYLNSGEKLNIDLPGPAAADRMAEYIEKLKV